MFKLSKEFIQTENISLIKQLVFRCKSYSSLKLVFVDKKKKRSVSFYDQMTKLICSTHRNHYLFLV